MKLLAPLLTVALLGACSQDANNAEPAASPAGTPDAQSMDMSEAQHQAMGMGRTTDEATGTSASATGTVESVDAEAGKIVIAHGAVDALGWPAMTMRFRIEPAQPPEGIRVGDPVAFQFRERNGGYSLTSISRR